MRKSGFALVGLLTLLSVGCSSLAWVSNLYRLNKPMLQSKYTDLEIPGYELAPWRPIGTLAGVGRTDITPPPGSEKGQS